MKNGPLSRSNAIQVVLGRIRLLFVVSESVEKPDRHEDFAI